MSKIKLVILLTIGILFLTITTIAEEITLTTYYPAPYGEYQNLYVSGNVGIGTTGPGAELHLAGSDNTPTLLIKPRTMVANDVSQIQFADPDGGTGPMSIQYKDDGSPDLAITGGNVGIGTTGPGAKLHVQGRIDTGTGSIRFMGQTTWDGSTDSLGRAQINVSPDANYDTLMIVGKAGGHGSALDSGSIGTRTVGIWDALYVNGNEYVTGNVGIGTAEPGSKLDVAGTAQLRGAAGGTGLYVKSNGNVGIGTTNPTQNLDINGRIRVRNNVGGIIRGVVGDIAEYIAVAENTSLLPGEVAVIDPKNPRCVTRSTRPYDTLVAGIISSKDQAAMIIGSEEPNNQLLALAGQVCVKVTQEGGPIQIGDLLTTSSTPGHAMKADPDKIRIGTVLGKALEPLDSGDGKIMVLVTLQ